jgi:hypothetical protein
LKTGSMNRNLHDIEIGKIELCGIMKNSSLLSTKIVSEQLKSNPENSRG